MTFETGKTYTCTSVCDHECVWTFEVERRTAKSIWIRINGKLERRAVKVWDGVEFFKPFGSYSMAPIVRAGGAP